MSEKSTPIDLSRLTAEDGVVHSPGTGDAGSAFDGRDSSSPLATSRGNSDPSNIGPGSIKSNMR